MNTNLDFVPFVSPPCEDQHNEVKKKSTCNCDKYRDITSFREPRKLSENFVKVNRIWCLNKVSAKRSQMIAKALKVSGV